MYTYVVCTCDLCSSHLQDMSAMKSPSTGTASAASPQTTVSVCVLSST